MIDPAIAAADALAYFATRATILEAAESLERHEFGAWDNALQDEGARELRALADTYHPVDER